MKSAAATSTLATLNEPGADRRLALAPKRQRLLWMAACLVFAAPTGAWAAAASGKLLEAEQAFALSAHVLDAKTLEIRYTIAPAYYVFKERLTFSAAQATLGKPILPKGQRKFDASFDRQTEVYHDEVRVRLPVRQAPARFQLQVTGQGCAEAGLCYPPLTQVIDVSLQGFGGNGSADVHSPEASQRLLEAAPSIKGQAADAASSGAVGQVLRR